MGGRRYKAVLLVLGAACTPMESEQLETASQASYGAASLGDDFALEESVYGAASLDDGVPPEESAYDATDVVLEDEMLSEDSPDENFEATFVAALEEESDDSTYFDPELGMEVSYVAASTPPHGHLNDSTLHDGETWQCKFKDGTRCKAKCYKTMKWPRPCTGHKDIICVYRRAAPPTCKKYSWPFSDTSYELHCSSDWKHVATYNPRPGCSCPRLTSLGLGYLLGSSLADRHQCL